MNTTASLREAACLTVEQEAYYRALLPSKQEPLLVLDCQRLRDQYNALQKALPNVKFFYAVKSLPHPVVVEELKRLGAGFDIASSGEADLMRMEHVYARTCIHTHPIKTDNEIRAALRLGCTTFVVDNINELHKLYEYRSRVGVLLRVSFRHQSALVDLSKKFGCTLAEVDHILDSARAMGIHIKGFSFHAGSQCADASMHVEAINACAALMKSSSHKMHVLDIGGGFPVSYRLDKNMDIDAFCAPIRAALATLPSAWQIIAEPGRFLSAPTMTAVSQVIGKTERSGTPWYYLNDGVYGSFSGQIYDHTVYPLSVSASDTALRPSVLAGPTCDSIDIIAENIALPDLAVGDLVVGSMMGAYTWATASRFNSLPAIAIVVVNRT